jgi:Mor family transcriptional regulator
MKLKLTDKQKLEIFDSLGNSWQSLINHEHIKKVMGLYSVYDLAKELKKHPAQITYHVEQGYVPAPSIEIEKRRYWTTEEYKLAKDWCSVRHYVKREKLLSNEKQREVREKYATGKYQQIELAKMYNVSQSNISRILRDDPNYKKHRVDK